MKDYKEPEIPLSDVPVHALAGAVRNALAVRAEVDASEIVVDAVGDAVLLTGAVNSLQEKVSAGRIAASAQGVKSVENDIVVSPGKSSSDRVIHNRVAEALSNFPPDNPARIGVRIVDQGIVYLAGKARSAAEVSRSVDLASGVSGVRQVISEIVVAPGVQIDEVDVRNAVMDALQDDPRVNPYGINVCIDRFDVYLDGEVGDAESVRAAEELAGQAPGVKHVVNRLVARR